MITVSILINGGKNEGNYKNYNFDRAFLFAYFIWSAIIRNELKRQWEEELCQK